MSDELAIADVLVMANTPCWIPVVPVNVLIPSSRIVPLPTFVTDDDPVMLE